MSSGWAAAAVAIVMMGLTFAGFIWRTGRRDGRIDAVLERLTDLTEDHEVRLRIIERSPVPQRRRPPRG